MAMKKIAFISSFLPRQCGLATFTSDLIKNSSIASDSELNPIIVAIETTPLNYDDRVKFKIRRDIKKDYIAAADYINYSGVSAVSLQHDFGLFGGEGGNYINLLLNQISVPIITTLHTILDDPIDIYLRELTNVAHISDKLIVMSHRGIDMLKQIYNIPKDKMIFIPHGIPDLGFVDSNYYKNNLGFGDRKLILTFGLLHRNKGIEWAIKALPDIASEYPNILYAIVGITHPEVKRSEGEEYRLSLQRLVKDLSLAEHVVFLNRFVSDDDLREYLSATDFYLTPYLSKEQIISGTLAFALGAGKAIISTPYWCAEELLSDDRGKLVPFRDENAIAQEILGLLNNQEDYDSICRRAYDFSRDMTWSKVGETYWKLFSQYSSPPSVKIPVSVIPAVKQISVKEIPEPYIDHLIRLTDDTGILQHAKYIVPDWRHGYCTDDNARALEVAALYYHQYGDALSLKLLNRYLSFVGYAQKQNGEFHNFMSYNRNFLKSEDIAGDVLGRVLSALGTVIAYPTHSLHLHFVREKFDLAIPNIEKQAIRGQAHSILGLAHYLKRFPDEDFVLKTLVLLADRLVHTFKKNATDDWAWFEDNLTYDNGVLPQALFVAYLVLKNKLYLDVANESCQFLLSKIYTGKCFSFVGCNGWYPKGKTKAQFDQQAIDAGSAVRMLGAAYNATKDPSYLDLQRTAFNWFLGVNDREVVLYDFSTHGCYDGLQESGVNLNQGAESLLSYMLAFLCIVESSQGDRMSSS